ncbi:hypothetical protein F444_01296 [Phytophthora nicotianae P1976]|uniref:Uncharacterized protein n=1 Tax=Phytophthora nicotianae P1976 TaxID=1317066 RepID=A0A081B136_PHYNI|nr:hypothetical protein F444_01296 [Phytophthora nicotianae P1976]
MWTSKTLDTPPNDLKTGGCREEMVDADEFDLLTTERDPPPTRDEIRKLPQELKKMRKLELHRKRMSRFRGRRAVEKKNMHEEFHRLLGQRLVNLRCSSVCGGPERITKVQRQLQQLVLEREWFRSESETLRQNLARVRNFTQVFQSARTSVDPDLNEPDSMNTPCHITVRRIHSIGNQSRNKLASVQEFDSILLRHDDNTANSSWDLAMGWCFAGLERLPQQNHPGKEWSFAHVQCSKRMYCSIDYIANRLTNKDGTSRWPMLPTERDNNFTTDIDIQTLQRFDEDPKQSLKY